MTLQVAWGVPHGQRTDDWFGGYAGVLPWLAMYAAGYSIAAGERHRMRQIP